MRSKCLSATSSIGQFRISDQKHPAGTVLPTNPNKTKTQKNTHTKTTCIREKIFTPSPELFKQKM